MYKFTIYGTKICRANNLFYISMWAYSAYKAIQGGQLRQGGLAVLRNSTCDIHYLKLGYQSVISVLNMAGLHTKQPPIRFLKLGGTSCEMAIFYCNYCSTIEHFTPQY